MKRDMSKNCGFGYQVMWVKRDSGEISEKEFESHIRNTLNLQYFECTKRFKSVGRAFRSGHITNFGFILPNRPYNNKKIANIYDLIDDVSLLDKFTRARKKVYKTEGWEVC